MSRYKKLLERVEELEQSNKSLLEQIEQDTLKEEVLSLRNGIHMYGGFYTQQVKVPSLKAKVDAILKHLELEVTVKEVKSSETIKAVSTKKAKK